MSEEEKETVYHYTDEESAKKIIKDGTIKQSISSDSANAVFGTGTYVTTLPPSHGKEAIARNNYDDMKGLQERKINEGKVDCAIKMEVSKAKLEKVDAGGRNVSIHHGDIPLKGKCSVEKTPDKPSK